MTSKKRDKGLINWKDYVNREYKKILTKNQNEADTIWNQNRAKMNELYEIDRCEWDTYSVTWENSETSTTIKSSNGFATEYLIPAVIPLPPMNSWFPTQQNISVDDELELFNIPYLGEDKIDENESFINELTETYGDCIDIGGEYDNYLFDSIFIELVNALIPYQSAESADDDISSRSTVGEIGAIGGNDVDPKNDKNLFPCHDIFKAIHEKFHNKGEPDKLRERYVNLTELFDADHCSPNVDDSNVSSEQKLHTYRSLFCRQCFKYDCVLHRESQENQSSTNSYRHRPNNLKPLNEPCSQWCYMHVDRKRETQTSPKNLTLELGSEASNDVSGTSNAEWTINWADSDMTMVRALHDVFSNNYCVIAKTMLTKTCQQVYEFCENELSSNGVGDVATNKRSYKKRKLHKINRQTDTRRLFALKKKSGSKGVHSYSPCTHSGPCSESCTCFLTKNYCEKFCGCNGECLYSFPGCKCKGQCKSDKCPCYVAHRECDPDLCQCGAEKIHEPNTTCKNVCIQRKQRKHLLMAPSDVAGWGIFLKDSVQKNEFISEYYGEIITQAEADRRGKLYDKLECSFLFDLNDDFVVDSTRIGNKIRFANHSSNPNCYAKILMVCGDHRIGIFAKRDIQSGEELFFDYRYGPTEKLKFVGIEGKVEFQ